MYIARKSRILYSTSPFSVSSEFMRDVYIAGILGCLFAAEARIYVHSRLNGKLRRPDM